jgi:hypothetical protein
LISIQTTGGGIIEHQGTNFPSSVYVPLSAKNSKCFSKKYGERFGEKSWRSDRLGLKNIVLEVGD